VDLPAHARRCRDDRLAVLREARDAAGAVEQAQAELRLEPIDGLADRGLDAAELARGGREAARLGDRAQRAQLLDGDALEHRSPFFHARRAASMPARNVSSLTRI